MLGQVFMVGWLLVTSATWQQCQEQQCAPIPPDSPLYMVPSTRISARYATHAECLRIRETMREEMLRSLAESQVFGMDQTAMGRIVDLSKPYLHWQATYECLPDDGTLTSTEGN